MRVEDLKRWQWIAIGLVVGLIASSLRNGVEMTSDVSTMDQIRFEQLLCEPPQGDQGQFPILRNIVVWPPDDIELIDRQGNTRHKRYSLVTFQWLMPNLRAAGWVYRPWAMRANVPYRPAIQQPRESAIASIQEYLSELSKTSAYVRFRYAWWAEPKTTYWLWTGGSILLIGGIWPTFLHWLVGAGFGRKEHASKVEDRLLGSASEPAKAWQTTTSEEGPQWLGHVEAAPRGTGNAMIPPLPAVPKEAGATPVKQLGAEPFDAMAEVRSAETKEYAGTFYPTAVHTATKQE